MSLIRLASVSVAAFVVSQSVVCLSRVRSRKLRAKFCHPYRKSGSKSKNMTSDFAPEVAKQPILAPNLKIVLSRSVKRCSLFRLFTVTGSHVSKNMNYLHLMPSLRVNLRKSAMTFAGDGTVDKALECDRRTNGRTNSGQTEQR